MRRTRSGCSTSPLISSSPARPGFAASLVPTTSAPISRFPGRPISSPSLRCWAARASSWRSPALTSAPSFGGIGSSREVMIASLAGASDDHDRVHAGADRRLDAFSTMAAEFVAPSPAVGLRVSLGMGLFALIMVAITETGRIPIDDPGNFISI